MTVKPQIVRHGECLLIPIDEIPDKAQLKETTKEKIIAFSETHHHHVLELTTPLLRVYELDNEMYLDVGDVGQLVHKKTGPDVHKTHTIAPGKYKVVIKKAFDYFTGALARVRD